MLGSFAGNEDTEIKITCKTCVKQTVKPHNMSDDNKCYWVKQSRKMLWRVVIHTGAVFSKEVSKDLLKI